MWRGPGRGCNLRRGGLLSRGRGGVVWRGGGGGLQEGADYAFSSRPNAKRATRRSAKKFTKGAILVLFRDSWARVWFGSGKRFGFLLRVGVLAADKLGVGGIPDDNG